MEVFRNIDHGADFGFEVYGRTEEELFQNGATALFSLITDPGCVETVIEKEVILDDGREALVVFLNELLYLWDVERFLPGSVTIVQTKGSKKAIVKGEFYDENRHIVRAEIKAVTYHMFTLNKEGGFLRATFVVDA